MRLESLRSLPGVIQRQSLEMWMLKNQNQKAEVAETGKDDYQAMLNMQSLEYF